MLSFFESQTLSLFLAWQEARHLSLAHRTGTLSHAPTVERLFDVAILDRPFHATLNTVSFEIHGNFSLYGSEWFGIEAFFAYSLSRTSVTLPSYSKGAINVPNKTYKIYIFFMPSWPYGSRSG
jgi:hypothetical protein